MYGQPQQYAPAPQYAPQYGQPGGLQPFPQPVIMTAPPIMSMESGATLQFLAQAPGLLIRQRPNWADIAAGLVGINLGSDDFQANVYEVKPFPPGHTGKEDTPLNDLIYKSLPTYFVAQEESDVCARLCCGTARGLTMHVKDVRTGFDAIRVIRPFKCTCFCGVPFLCGDYINPQEINVITVGAGGMPGPSIGGAKQVFRQCSCSNVLQVTDASGAVAYNIAGSCLQCGPNCCCPVYSMTIEDPSGADTGARVLNVFPGCNCRGLFSRADNLSVSFPQSASAELRTVLLSAAFLLDYMIFEKPQSDDQNAGGGNNGF